MLFLNVNDKRAEKDGKLLPGIANDKLHLTLKGYQAWGEGLTMAALLLIFFFVPGASGLLVGAAASLTAALGVPREAIAGGWDAFHFWR